MRCLKQESSSYEEPDHTFNRKASQKQPCAKKYRINRVHIVSYQDLVLDSQNTFQMKTALLLEASGRWWIAEVVQYLVCWLTWEHTVFADYENKRVLSNSVHRHCEILRRNMMKNNFLNGDLEKVKWFCSVHHFWPNLR